MATSRKENGSLVRKAGKIIVDLVLNLASNRPIANSAVARQFGGLKFRNNDGTAQYSLDDGTTWENFSKGAILIGTYSSNTTVDVSAYGATSADQFLVVCDTHDYTNTFYGSGSSQFGCESHYYPPSVSLNGTTLTVNVGSAYGALYGYGGYVGTSSKILVTKLYFVGDVVSAS